MDSIKPLGPRESIVHEQVCNYIRAKYPNVIFNSDGAGNNLSRAQAGMAKMLRSVPGFPDLQIPEPRGGYHGLFLELKREGVRVFLEDGSLSTNRHIVEQEHMLDLLQRHGYAADFAIGYDEAVSKIDWYMKLEVPDVKR